MTEATSLSQALSPGHLRSLFFGGLLFLLVRPLVTQTAASVLWLRPVLGREGRPLMFYMGRARQYLPLVGEYRDTGQV